MAIIEPHVQGLPLSQGDILKGIRLFLSRERADAGAFEPAEAKFGMCLVLSRQCVVKHKQSLIVAGIVKYSEDVKPDMSFEETVDFLETAREGVNTPDQFYLGHIPSQAGRFCARLDSLHTIELPKKPEDRQAFVDAHRVARMNGDFVRDLHIRVHQAFANMGFEDYQWLPDEDLRLIVEKGNSELRMIQEKQRMAQMTRESSGTKTDASQITKDQNIIGALSKKLQPYVEEWEKRYPKEPDPGSPATGG